MKTIIINSETAKHHTADKDYYITISLILSLAKIAYDIFKSSEPMEKRAILGFMLQNPTVSGKKLEFMLRKPFNTVLELATCPIGLALLNDFRKFDWAEEYKYPTVILAQMNQLLAECRDDQPVVTP